LEGNAPSHYQSIRADETFDPTSDAENAPTALLLTYVQDNHSFFFFAALRA
jgi:hypothetical protein